MGNSVVSKSKRRLSDFSDVSQDLREHESNMREKIMRGDCKDSGLSGEFSSSYSASSEYLSPEPPVSTLLLYVNISTSILSILCLLFGY